MRSIIKDMNIIYNKYVSLIDKKTFFCISNNINYYYKVEIQLIDKGIS